MSDEDARPLPEDGEQSDLDGDEGQQLEDLRAVRDEALALFDGQREPSPEDAPRILDRLAALALDLPERPDRLAPHDARKAAALPRVYDRLRECLPDEDATATDLTAWLWRALEPIDRRLPLPVSQIDGDEPAPLLSLANQPDALLRRGTVGLLSGEGGVGKSYLSLALALDYANAGDGQLIAGDLFTATTPGPVLVAAFEDDERIIKARLLAMKKAIQREADSPNADASAKRRALLLDLDRVHVLPMRSRPLFGPEPGAHYNSRPRVLPGWSDLWAGVDSIKKPAPALIIVDTLGAAFVGSRNAAEGVSEFLSALAYEAERRGCAVLGLGHSTKAARKEADPLHPGNAAGSAAWFDAARAVLSMLWGEDGERLLVVPKANYGPANLSVSVKPKTADSGGIVGIEQVDGSIGWEPVKRNPSGRSTSTSPKTNGAAHGGLPEPVVTW